MYKVYIENNVILFVEQEPTDPENEALRMHINLNDTFSITKLLQKLQFTKKFVHRCVLSRPEGDGSPTDRTGF